MKRIPLLLLLSACAAGPDLPKTATPTHADAAQVQVLLDKANAAYKQASKTADVEPLMVQYEDVLKLAPDHKEALIRASELHYFHGADVVPASDKDKRMQTYLRGRELGLRAMALNATWRQAYEKDNDMVKQMPLLTVDDTAAAYWAATNWAKWGELYGIVRAAIDIPKVKALMDFVETKAPLFNGNGADRFFVGYWVAIPGFAGKDAKKSKAAYEKATKESPQWLFNHITFAEYYARDLEDRALFESTIKKVLDAPAEPDGSPIKLQNGIAKEEARVLLTHTKEWFE